MNISILYEDMDIVVINKPSGMMVHPDGRTKKETVSDWFMKKYPESTEVGEIQRLVDGTEIARPGIVHRLDTDTSGVLVLVKTSEAHTFFKKAFQDREVEKTYLAFVYGVPKKRGIIDFSIGRSRKDFRLKSAQPKAKGRLRDALTHYRTLDEVIIDNAKFALLKVCPKTGRTHQIRVHLKAIHHPIIGDPLYAPNHLPVFGLNRLGLHSYSIDIPLLSGNRTVMCAPLPEDLKIALGYFSIQEEHLLGS